MTDTPVTETIPAPEIYVDGFEGYAVTNGIVKMPLWSLVRNHGGDTEERRIVLRLATTLPAIQGMHQVLGELLTRVRREMELMKEEVAN